MMPVFSQETLRINTGWNASQKTLIKNFLDELFVRLDIDYILQELPPERALKNANMGLDDGDAVRVFEVGEMFPNLLRVNDHLFSANFSAFYINQEITIKNVEDMKYRTIGIVNGAKIVQSFVKKHEFKDVKKALDSEQVLRALLHEDVEIIISNRRPLLTHAKKMHLENFIIEHKPSLIQKKMYLYMHKKHKDLVPIIEKELHKMKEDGSYAKIMNAYVQKYPSQKGYIDAK